LAQLQTKLEHQQQQIDHIFQLIQHNNDNDKQQLEQLQLQQPQLNPAKKTLKTMIFIDGTWLYYSLYEHSIRDCHIIQKFGWGWPLRYDVRWEILPQLIADNLAVSRSSSNSSTTTTNDNHHDDYQLEIVKSSVYTSYKTETSKNSYRYRMFEEMKKSQVYDVHMMETLGNIEKCVDIQLAVEMLHYATLPDAYDVAIMLSGDKDFMPALMRIRQKGKRIGIVSMRRDCSRALFETPGIRDYDVLWLENYLDQLIVPKENSPESGGHTLSLFTMIKVINDFIRHSPSKLQRVSSRDIGLYLKFLKMQEKASLLDEIKMFYSGLFTFLLTSGFYNIETADTSSSSNSNNNNKDDPQDWSYWVSNRSDADQLLMLEAKKTTFNQVEKAFFQRYNNIETLLSDKEKFYPFTHIQMGKDELVDAQTTILSDHVDAGIEKYKINDSPMGTASHQQEELSIESIDDFRNATVAELKEFCRQNDLPVSGVKAVLLQRVQEFLEQTRFQRQASLESARLPPSPDDEQIEKYLRDLIVEFLHASGGAAGSRNVGRYLAANKALEQKPGIQVSALQELKSNYGSLAAFVNRLPEYLSADMTDVDSKGNRFEFQIVLQEKAGTKMTT
jgi:hypothetical protein